MRRLIEPTKTEDVELIEGVRIRRGDEWVAAIPDADRACFHVVAEAGDRDRARGARRGVPRTHRGWRREAS